MAKCPKCGTEVAQMSKKWTMAGRPDKSGKRMRLEIGLYECPRCHKTFRNMLNKKKGFVSPIIPPTDEGGPHRSPFGEPEKNEDDEDDEEEDS
jgi:DNA-directed RNA polymerase subunit RPC12/RpoP